MPLTANDVADEFLAAANAAGLRKVSVLVGQVDFMYVVTMTMPNPFATGMDDDVLVLSNLYELFDLTDAKRFAADRARLFAEAMPTVH